jgi:hypothetical protein
MQRIAVVLALAFGLVVLAQSTTTTYECRGDFETTRTCIFVMNTDSSTLEETCVFTYKPSFRSECRTSERPRVRTLPASNIPFVPRASEFDWIEEACKAAIPMGSSRVKNAMVFMPNIVVPSPPWYSTNTPNGVVWCIFD